MNLLALASIFFLSGLETAHAASCTAAGVCAGDQTYAYYRRSVHPGVAKSVGASDTVVFLAQGEKKSVTLPADRVAVVKAGACLPSSPQVCVGVASHRRDGRGGQVEGQVLGFYPNGFVVVSENGDLSSVAADRFDSFGTLAAAVPVPPVAPAIPADDKTLLQVADAAKKGQDLPLAAFLKFWTASDDHPGGPNPFAKCLDGDQANHPAKHDDDWYLVPECQPDNLYSWGPLVKIQELAGKIGDGPWTARPFFNDALFLAESPASSFGYGSSDTSGGYAIRVKIRPGVRFKFIRSAPQCPSYSEDEAANTVYIHIFVNDHGDGKISSGQDFVLCSSGPVESWSYGTRQFYDELVNDVLRIRDPAHKYDYLSYMTRPGPDGKLEPAIFELGSDGHPFSEEQLINTLKLQLGLAAGNEGKVYFNPKVRADGKVASEAFTTRIPNWFNGNAAP